MPLTPGVCGPGFNVAGESDFIGPLPVGAHWQVNLQAAATSNYVCYGEQDTDVPFFNFVIGWNYRFGGFMTSNAAYPDTLHGQAGTLTVRLLNAGAGVIDSGVFSTTIDLLSGQHWMITQVYNGLHPQTAQLDQLLAAVIRTFPPA